MTTAPNENLPFTDHKKETQSDGVTKYPDVYYTVSEISRLTGMSRNTVRRVIIRALVKIRRSPQAELLQELWEYRKRHPRTVPEGPVFTRDMAGCILGKNTLY